MAINGDYTSRGPLKTGGDIISPIIGEEMAAAFIGEDELEKNPNLNKRKVKSKKSDRPASLQALDQDTGMKDTLNRMADKLAQADVAKAQKNLQKNISKEISETVNKIFGSAPESTQDAVVLSKAALANDTQIQKKQRHDQQEKVRGDNLKRLNAELDRALESTQNAGREKAKTKASDAQTQKATVSKQAHETGMKDTFQRFLGAYSETLVKKSDKKAQEVENYRQKLLSEGMPLSKIKTAESNVQRFIRNDLKRKIKDNFLRFALSYQRDDSTLDLLKKFNAFEQISDIGRFAGLYGPGRETVDTVKNEAREELRHFIADELDRSLVEAKLQNKSIEQIIAAFDRFNELASIARFDPSEYMKDLARKMEDFGLKKFEAPIPDSIIAHSADVSADSHGGQSRPGLPETEIEELEDELRTILMQKYIKRDPISAVELAFKARRIKKKLKKADALTDKRFATINREAEGMARIKMTDMLRETFEERATMSELKGPAYRLVQNKMKSAIKGLKAMGHALSKNEMRAMRNQVNKAFFTLIKEEYVKLKVQIETDPNNVGLIKQEKAWQTLLKRLKKESNIREDIDMKLFQDTSFATDTKIIEAA